MSEPVCNCTHGIYWHEGHGKCDKCDCLFFMVKSRIIEDYADELREGLVELAAVHTNDVSRYMGIRDAIKYIEDSSRKHRLGRK